jgi:hypothetical protein
MQGLILTAKHHDGFCLWHPQYTTHSVTHSPWRDSHGDVVAELAQACAAAGLKFGIYLSPWATQPPDYGTSGYLTYYRNQLRELLSNYGSLFEVWFDGANGGDGYYGGSYEVRKIDAKTYYEWDETLAMVRTLQPDACIFSDALPMYAGWAMSMASPAILAGQPLIPPTSILALADPAYLNTGERHCAMASCRDAMYRSGQAGFITNTKTTRCARRQICGSYTWRRWDGVLIYWSIYPSHRRGKSMRKIGEFVSVSCDAPGRFLPKTTSTKPNSAPARYMKIICSMMLPARFGCQKVPIRHHG